jgi:hypothetical protein
MMNADAMQKSQERLSAKKVLNHKGAEIGYIHEYKMRKRLNVVKIDWSDH